MPEPTLIDEVPSKAMVVIPHPDDGEISCGGAVAKWASAGCEVVFVLCTNGDKGSGDEEMTPARLAPVREEEQLNAAKALGVKEVVFLRHPDGELEDDRQFRGELVREIRRHAPDVVFCFDPYRRTHAHRDHRISGQVAMDAVFPFARDHLHFPEMLSEFNLPPHKVLTVYLWGADEPDSYMDITDSIEAKVDALKQHVSQVGHRDVSEFIEQRARTVGEAVGVTYAEAFRRVGMRR